MKTHSFKNITGIALLASSSLIMTGTASAETLADVSITNQATVNYKVATVSQTAVPSNAHTFKVDRRVNFTVTRVDGAAIAASPGTVTALTFVVQNDSNDTLDFNLTTASISGGAAAFGTDTIDSDGTIFVFADANGNGTYDPGTDTSTVLEDVGIGAGNTKKAFIVTTFSTAAYAAGTFTNADIAGYHIVATAADKTSSVNLSDHSGVADDPAVVQNVFNDAIGSYSGAGNDGTKDGQYSAVSEYVISSANLSVTKSSTVISDPISLTVNPKAIPGAVIRYTISIQNTGTADATDLSVTDGELATEITNNDLSYNVGTIIITAPQVNGGVAVTLTDAADGAESGTTSGQWVANALTVAGFDLLQTETATITFEITLTAP